MGELKPDIVENVERYNLWLIPQMPMDMPLVRPRRGGVKWRVRMLDSIREEGLRHPILCYGHHPKGRFNLEKWGDANLEQTHKDIYIAFGTNRYWCCKELGWDTFPAILSYNKGRTPPCEGEIITPQEFRNYAPAGRVFVQEHGFGYKLAEFPEEEFAKE